MTFFDQLDRLSAVGKDFMNNELLSLVQEERPELVLVVLYRDELQPVTIRQISRSAITVGYLYDDSWRIGYALRWAQHFDFITTGEPEGLERFARIGVRNVLLAPFGFNSALYTPASAPVRRQLSFFGLPHPYRSWVIERIERAGHQVLVSGAGWPRGKSTLEEMVRTISESAINLNISNSRHWELPYLLSSPKALAWNLARSKVGEQVKGRHFEIPGCGGFQLSHEVPGLRHFFREGEEVVTYSSVEDLLRKVEYYMYYADEREAIARRGHERAMREHTAQRYLSRLLDTALGPPGT